MPCTHTQECSPHCCKLICRLSLIMTILQPWWLVIQTMSQVGSLITCTSPLINSRCSTLLTAVTRRILVFPATVMMTLSVTDMFYIAGLNSTARVMINELMTIYIVPAILSLTDHPLSHYQPPRVPSHCTLSLYILYRLKFMLPCIVFLYVYILST